jgi:hypothetical protein
MHFCFRMIRLTGFYKQIIEYPVRYSLITAKSSNKLHPF